MDNPDSVSKLDHYIDKGWECFGNAITVSGEERNKLLRKAITYLSLAEKENPVKIEDKYLIYGLISFCFAWIDENERAKQYMKVALDSDPNNYWARLAAHFIALDDWGNYKGLTYQDDGSTAGLFAALITVGVSSAVNNRKRNSVLNTAIDAANAFQYHYQNTNQPSAQGLYVRFWLLKVITENLWEAKIRDRHLCDILLATPWDNVDPESISDRKKFDEVVEDEMIEVQGLLAMLK